jgi:hypothetical protein
MRKSSIGIIAPGGLDHKGRFDTMPLFPIDADWMIEEDSHGSWVKTVSKKLLEIVKDFDQRGKRKSD